MNQTYFVLTPDGICKKFLSGALTKEEAIRTTWIRQMEKFQKAH